MAAASRPSPSDADRASVADAVALARRAREAQTALAELSQRQIDAVVDAMAAAIRPHAETLARQAVEETGFGVVADKTAKNRFASDQVHAFIRPMTTVGVVARHPDRGLVEIAEPFGVVAAVVPSTNPTSTTIYKLLISLKARCAVVLSPHPSAAACITRTASIMAEAAIGAGMPAGAIGWMQQATLEGTQALMRARDVAVILATGGLGLVRAAYSAGKPAYGVGPGNAPCYIDGTADVDKAVDDILAGKCFDHGVLCSSPNAVVVDRAVASRVRGAFAAQGGHLLSPAEVAQLSRVLITEQRLPNPALVGRSAAVVAEAAGLQIPSGTRALLAPLDGVGRDYPLSVEKLCPVLAYYEVADWREGCERCTAILRYGGLGHTMSVHATDDQVVLAFGLRKPAFRICVNTSTSHGSIGLTTGLDPALTLGCGGLGGNITSDNITPRHLLNIKRLAYEVRPRQGAARVGTPAAGIAGAPADGPSRPLGARIDAFLASRGLVPSAEASPVTRAAPVAAAAVPPVSEAAAPEAFVCEDDVRRAAREGRRLRIGPGTIVTPAARDAGAALGVLDGDRGPS